MGRDATQRHWRSRRNIKADIASTHCHVIRGSTLTLMENELFGITDIAYIHYSPLNTGLRFSPNAAKASVLSLVTSNGS